MPGWTSRSIVPKSSSIGGVNGLAQLPISAADLLANTGATNDSKLESRTYMNAPANSRQVAASTSVYAQPNAPAFLADRVADLNSEQTLRRSAQAELLNRIVQGAQGGGDDAYLWQEALRAAAVNPGAAVYFGQSVQNPLIGQGYNTSAQAGANKMYAQSTAIRQATDQQSQLQQLMAKRAQLASVPSYGWGNSDLNNIDNQIHAIQTQGNSTQRLGQAAAGSGWSGPALPRY